MKKQLLSTNQKKNRTRTSRLSLIAGVALFFFFISGTEHVKGIPSYARQTGMSCSACHTVFPELTSFGRQFKLNGYTLTTEKTIQQTIDKKGDQKRTVLNLLDNAPLALMFQTGFTHLSKAESGTKNDNIEFPQQLSLFYGGQIAPHFGAFIQLTMDHTGAFGLDNTDIRYSNKISGKMPFTYGFTLNNVPSVQDLWNTTPAWGFPYSGSGIAPGPAAGTFIEAMGGSVAGLGAYGFLNNLVYFEATGYANSQLTADLAPPDATMQGMIKGVAPYWRVALQHQWDKVYWELGTFGVAAKQYPSGISGDTDDYTDLGFDTQFEYMFPKGQFTLHSSYVNEKQTLTASHNAGDSQNSSNTLNSFKVDGSVFFQTGINLTLGYFNISGTSDAGLYAPTDQPDSNGLIGQISYLPWLNTKLSLQYVAYSKFNGAKSNYDGSGRSSSDNNTLYLQLWYLF